MNLAFGFILQNIQNDDNFQYYNPAENNTVFETTKVLSDRDDLNSILNRLEQKNLFEDLIKERPDTKWKMHSLKNVTFFLYHLTNVPLGCYETQIPTSVEK